MKEIQLTQNKVTIVDDDLFDLLNQFKWYASKNGNTYYAIRNIRRVSGQSQRKMPMHRFIMQVTDSKIVIDHEDNNGLHNWKSNLRIATHSQNQANRIPRKNTTSNYLGVSFFKVSNKWRASIKKDSKGYNLGYYFSEEEAAKAYDKAAIELHGKFSNLNFKLNS